MSAFFFQKWDKEIKSAKVCAVNMKLSLAAG